MASQFGFHTAAMVVAGFLSGSAALAQNGAWVDPPPLQTAISPAPQVVSPPPLQDSPSIAHSSPKPQSTEGPRSVAAPLPVHPVPSAGRQSSRSKALVTRPARTGMAQVAPPRRLSRIGHPTAPRVRRPATTEVAEVGPPRRLSRISPSFNCRAARSPVEHAICGAPVLARKDRRMAILYEQAGGSRYGPVDSVQWNWIVARNRCARARGAALESCVHRAYDDRLAELSKR